MRGRERHIAGSATRKGISVTMGAPLVGAAAFDPSTRTWIVAHCPHCGRQHRHRLRKAGAPQDALGWVETPCRRAYELVAAERQQLKMTFAEVA